MHKQKITVGIHACTSVCTMDTTSYTTLVVGGVCASRTLQLVLARVVVVVISNDCYSNQPLPASFKTIIYYQLVYNISRPRKIIIVILASIQI